ncbi:MAG: hypothetical protein FK733_01545 [Asgard group archaeon]|nr:hypothetical protein [Asgard group archaeon]
MDDACSVEVVSPYLSEEVNLKKRTPFHAQWEIFKIRSWRFLAHHPTCSRYHNHFYKIGSFHFCIGCSMLYSSILLYLILFLAVRPVFRDNVWVISTIPFAGFGLAIIHKIFRIKNKWIKGVFRFSAGFGVGAYCGLLIEILFIPKRWWIAIILAVILLLGNQMYGLSRGYNANRRECIDCPLNAQEPKCNPDKNTNIRVRKIYAIIEEELEKARKQTKSTQKD